MKKLVLASILVASSLFAADIAADAKALSDAAYENKIKAGKLEKQAYELRSEFREQMRNKLEALSDEDRAKFMQEFRKNMDEKIDKLSVKEARELGFGRHFARGEGCSGDGRGFGGHERGKFSPKFGGCGGAGMHHGMGGMSPCGGELKFDKPMTKDQAKSENK